VSLATLFASAGGLFLIEDYLISTILLGKVGRIVQGLLRHRPRVIDRRG
jgi:hypothetical protein